MRKVILLPDAANRLLSHYPFILETDLLYKNLKEFEGLPVILDESDLYNNSIRTCHESSGETKTLVSGLPKKLILHKELPTDKTFKDYL